MQSLDVLREKGALNTFKMPHRWISSSTKELYIKSGPSSENYSCHPFRNPFRSFFFIFAREKKTAKLLPFESSSFESIQLVFSSPSPTRWVWKCIFFSLSTSSPNTLLYFHSSCFERKKETTTKMHGPSTRCSVFRRGWAFKRISLPPFWTFFWTLSAFCFLKKRERGFHCFQ